MLFLEICKSFEMIYCPSHLLSEKDFTTLFFYYYILFISGDILRKVSARFLIIRFDSYNSVNRITFMFYQMCG